MESFFSADFFQSNRTKLRELFTGTAPIVITANGLLQRNGDTAYPFRQDSNFWYLTGIEVPEAVLVMDKSNEYLIIPDLSPTDEIFGAPYDYQAIADRSGISTILRAKDGWKQLESRLKKVKHAATLSSAPTYVGHAGFYSNPARRRLIKRIKTINPNLELLDLRKHMALLRMVKQPGELAAINKAIDITSQAIGNIRDNLSSYEHEYEIEADITRTFRAQGAMGHAFAPIVAGGGNTCHLHYQDNNQTLVKKRLLYVDVGAEVEHYSADITRTYFLVPPSKREQAVYNAVEEVAAFALSNLKPKITLRDNEKLVEHYMGEKLRELGLIKSINHDQVRKFYTHACSHFLGLDTHDSGDYDRPLEPNMVLTVEPGIYISAEGFGIRIENDVVITEKGCKVLSAQLQ